MGYVHAMFGASQAQDGYVAVIKSRLDKFVEATGLLESALVPEAAEYLFYELAGEDEFVVSQTARELKDDLEKHLTKRGFTESLHRSMQALAQDPVSGFRLLADWARSYLADAGRSDRCEYAEEIAALFLPGLGVKWTVIPTSIERTLAGMAGSHPRIEQGAYRLNYCHFMTRLRQHEKDVRAPVRPVPEVPQRHCRAIQQGAAPR